MDEYTLILFPAYTTTIKPAAYNAENAASSIPAVTGGDIATATPSASVGGSGSGSGLPASTSQGAGAAGTSAAASPSTTKSDASGQMISLRGTSVLAATTLLILALV